VTAPLVFTMLSGLIELQNGQKILMGPGDPLPLGMAAGELERLQQLGAVAETYERPPWVPEPAPERVRLMRRLAGLPVEEPS
jgi:hypothetical protein